MHLGTVGSVQPSCHSGMQYLIAVHVSAFIALEMQWKFPDGASGLHLE